MHRRDYRLQRRDHWQFCLAAIAEVIHTLPPLYQAVDLGTDDVAVELRMKAGAWEVLHLNGATDDKVAASISSHLNNTPAYPFPDWLINATSQLESDLQWAETRSCPDQAAEILSALVTFRASMLRGSPF